MYTDCYNCNNDGYVEIVNRNFRYPHVIPCPECSETDFIDGFFYEDLEEYY